MPNTVLGKVSVTPKGAWSGSSSYEKLDIVSNGGNSYIALQNVPSGTALSNSSYWLMIAQKGDKGNTGEITGASASISGGYGTPSVSVTSGGTSTDRSFAFAFSNLKGNGISAVNCEKTGTSGAVDTYTLTISEDDGTVNTFALEVTNGSVTSVNGRTGAVEGLAEEEDLIKAFPNDTASGDIASFPDGADMPVKGMKINVEPYQNLNGYDYPWVGGAGKNLLKNTARSQTINGVTFTVNADGTVLANGTASAEANIVLISGTGIFDFNTDTILSGSVGGFGNNVRIRFGVTNPAAAYDDFGNGVTIPRIADISSQYAYVQITINSGTTVNNITFRPMIRLATETDPTFAPYENICPIYPANGKNLYNKDIPLLDGYISATGEITTDGSSKHSYMIPVVGGQNYTISGKTGNIRSNTIKRFHGYDSNGDWVQQLGASAYLGANANYAVTISVPSTVVGMMISFGNVENGTKPDSDVQLERGSFATSYVPYRAFGMTRTGKNLLVPNVITYTNHGVTYTINADGSVLLNGTASGTFTAVAGSIFLKTNVTYVLSGAVSGTVSMSLRKRTGEILRNGGSPYTATEDIYADYYLRMESGATVSNLMVYPQIEVGTVATAYEPYQPSERYYSRNYNMWDEEWEVGNINNTTGENQVSTQCIRSKNYIPVEPNTKYYTNGFRSNVGIYEIYFYGSDKTFLHEMANTNSFTTSANAHFMRFRCANAYGTTYKNDIQINYSNPSQVGYGGVLDVDTGLLTVTMGTETFSSAPSGNWGTSTVGGSSAYIHTVSTMKKGQLQKGYANWLKTKTAIDGTTGIQFGGGANSNIIYCIGINEAIGTTDLASFSTYLATNPLQIVYPLATPVQYQLTPTQVKTLLGYNNIWTDSGTVEVNYLADTSLYIQKLTGSTEEDMIANANIANGKYFMVGNELFLSTSAIAQGASIVVGTNCIKTNLADALNALNS
jgi:hypothetical protein